ncbi:UV radiation resistance protein and autophagy-related subunit 14-domain-containing protein [Bombardia bombarda]|uniref:Autophagy-related protein 14 n=1 Tax=Bombardia bombarda TaxID=252184 RepID=A0AA40CAC4_9PEZI|nr:UV radiation resistance protein and autophagy-related subunit 14-domain-containing protein [Bombardia bombarda]
MSATVIVGQAPINLGPLTTTFIPPPSCTVAVGAVDSGPLGLGLLGRPIDNVAVLGQTCTRGRPVDATSCWPPTSSGALSISKSASLGGRGFYSPGVHCPAGYATACSATGGSGGGSGWPVQFKLLAGETAVGCCPSGYGCANINGQTCTMVATSTTVPLVTCDGTKSGDFGFQTVPDAKASITAFSLFAPMIQINWQSTDRTEATSTGSGTSVVPAATPTTVTRTKSTSQPATTSGTQSIDTGAAAGIETLETAGGPDPTVAVVAPTAGADSTTASPSPSSSTGQKSASSESSGGLSASTTVGLGVTGGVLGFIAIFAVVICMWRRRRTQREEEEMDRLYGMKQTGSNGDLVSHDDIPGWYRGQRPIAPPSLPLTPTVDPFRGATLEPTGLSSPYYRPYRPCPPKPKAKQGHDILLGPRRACITADARDETMSTESTRPLLLPQNRKLRHLRGIHLRNLTFTRPRGRTIDDAALNKSPSKLEALRETPQLHHALSSEDLRPPAGRRRSTNLSNGNPLTRQKRIEDAFDSKLADAFFTLHVPAETDPVYISEVSERATNFNFRPFELAELDSAVTRSPQVTIKVWTRRRDAWSLLLEDEVDLRALNWLGSVQSVHFPPNSLVFHMVDGIYSIELSGKVPAPKQTAPLPTSSYNALMRLATLDNSIQDAIATRDAVAKQINDLLERTPKNELPEAQDKLALANKYLAQQRRAVAAAAKRNTDLKASIAARKAAIEQGRALQQKAARDVENATEHLAQSKLLSAKTKQDIHGQRRRICEDLSRIFSITPVPPPSTTGGAPAPPPPPPPPPLSFQICGTPLPNTVYDSTTSHKQSGEDALSAALGHVAQLVDALQYYLGVPLPYPIRPFGSRASVRDDISQLPDLQREFPLYVPRGGSSAQFRFEYGWFILNKDIEVLCHSQGLKVVDLRHTLPNLKYLLYVCSAGSEEMPERKRGGVRGLWQGRIKTMGGGVVGMAGADEDERSSLGGGGGGSRRGSDASDVPTGGKGGFVSAPPSISLPFEEGGTKLTLRTKGLRENAAR